MAVNHLRISPYLNTNVFTEQTLDAVSIGKIVRIALNFADKDKSIRS